jgi:hypothetical protein
VLTRLALRPSFVVTVAVASAVGFATLAGGWALQAALLPPPERGDVVAARAVSWLVAYRLVESTFRIGDAPPVHGRCLQFPLLGGLAGRGLILRLDNGLSVIESGPHELRVEGATRSEPRGLPITQLELAGCPPVLVSRIAGLVQSHSSVHVERSFVAGRPALALRVPTTLNRIVIYLAPKTYRPIGVSVTSGRFSGLARIRLTRLTPVLLRVLDGARR